MGLFCDKATYAQKKYVCGLSFQTNITYHFFDKCRNSINGETFILKNRGEEKKWLSRPTYSSLTLPPHPTPPPPLPSEPTQK